MCNIISHYENWNQNPNKIPLHIHQDGYNQKDRQQQALQGCGETGALIHCWWQWKMVQLVWKRVYQFLKSKHRDLAIPFLGIHPREMKTYVLTQTCTQMFIAGLFVNSQKLWTTQMSINRWRNNWMWYIYTMEHFLEIKRNEVLIHTKKWMNLKNMLSEWSQAQKSHIWFYLHEISRRQIYRTRN